MSEQEHTGDTTVPTPEDSEPAAGEQLSSVPAVVVMSCAEAPRRVGEVGHLAVRGRPYSLGRDPNAELPRLRIGPQRPGSHDDSGPFTSVGISREQLRVQAKSYGVEVKVMGRCPTFRNEEPMKMGTTFRAAPGDQIYLDGQVLLMVTRRERFPPRRYFPEWACGEFGEADKLGIAGESAVIWALRDAIAYAAKLNLPILVRGGSGSGKELVAKGIHLLSGRASGAFVPCNCAAIPRTLAEGELFGCARDWPQKGMPERPGFVGRAQGGTLFLDEIGEMPREMQSTLLRFVAEGEYQRPGDGMPRPADVLAVAATNRPLSDLKDDVRARFGVIIEVPSLERRREDNPLLVRQLLLEAEAKNNVIAAAALAIDANGWRYPTLKGSQMRELVSGHYPENVRSLKLELFRILSGEPRAKESAPPAPTASPGAELDTESLLAGLERHRGNRTKLATELGVSRPALYRSLKKHGISDDDEGDDDE